MPEYARKTVVDFHGNALEMYMKPNGVYGLSQTQVGEVIGMSDKVLPRFLESDAPEALPFKGFTPDIVYIGQGNLRINFIPIPLGSAVWVHHGKKGNAKALALGAGNLVDTLTRLADNAFGVIKTEGQYRQEAISNIQNFELMFERLLNPMLDRIEQMDNNIKALTPYIEKGKIADTVYKMFPNFDNLWENIAQEITAPPTQEFRYVSQWAYEMGFRGLSRGEMICVGVEVSSFAKFGKPEWLPKDSDKKGRKKYPEAFKPVIRDAILHTLAKRNNVRLIH
jgi:hypothetical protein